MKTNYALLTFALVLGSGFNSYAENPNKNYWRKPTGANFFNVQRLSLSEKITASINYSGAFESAQPDVIFLLSDGNEGFVAESLLGCVTNVKTDDQQRVKSFRLRFPLPHPVTKELTGSGFKFYGYTLIVDNDFEHREEQSFRTTKAFVIGGDGHGILFEKTEAATEAFGPQYLPNTASKLMDPDAQCSF